MPFAIPMVWHKPKDHSTDCYFYLTNAKGYSVKTRSKIEYPNVPSVLRLMSHGLEMPVPNPPISSTCESESSEEDSCMDPDFKENLESISTPPY